MNINVFRYLKKTSFFLKHNRDFTFGFIILASLMIQAFIVSLFAPFDPRRWNTVPRTQPPSIKYPLGTTALGQDVFWLLTYALKNSFIISIVASAVGLIIGVMFGLLAGYSGGMIDKIILLFADTLIVTPKLPILILLASIIKKQLNMFNLGLIIAALTWGMPIRNVRSMILSLREREFSYTAQFSGSNTLSIVVFEYLPHVLPWVLSSFIGRILMAIGYEITLAVVGLSSTAEATLGTIIYWAMNYQALVRGLWWWIFAPILASVLLFISLYIVFTSITENLDPRKKIQRIQR